MDITFSEKERQSLEKLGITVVVLFGSRAQGLEREKSDIDIGVLIKSAKTLSSAEKRKEVYDAMYEMLSAHANQLVNIDIVFLDNAPGELQAHVMKHGKPLFEANEGVFADFREKVMLTYSDFEYLRNVFHRGILARIA
ncbi:nucleotidyltransferase domain-containing protein [bacterium]|nr:nucleotidyltransferase domain-containing protein [bacterium]